jgi:hypothetical protein
MSSQTCPPVVKSSGGPSARPEPEKASVHACPKQKFPPGRGQFSPGRSQLLFLARAQISQPRPLAQAGPIPIRNQAESPMDTRPCSAKLRGTNLRLGS